MPIWPMISHKIFSIMISSDILKSLDLNIYSTDLTMNYDLDLSVSVVIRLQYPPFDVTVRHFDGPVSHPGSDHRDNSMTSWGEITADSPTSSSSGCLMLSVMCVRAGLKMTQKHMCINGVWMCFVSFVEIFDEFIAFIVFQACSMLF